MFRLCLLVLIACALTGSISQKALGEEPHEIWLKAIEGTWTWNDEVRGKVTLTFEPHAQGKCMVGIGKDDTGSFVAIVGWEAWSKTLTDTGFHSNGGGGRIVYSEITATTLKGTLTGAGPGGEAQPESRFDVVRDANTITVTATDANGEKTTNVLTKVVEN